MWSVLRNPKYLKIEWGVLYFSIMFMCLLVFSSECCVFISLCIYKTADTLARLCEILTVSVD